ncbi:hypothetical protein EOPP23_08955 [Endozoicomonas sp. OPT23]|uniref:hypothetical protein n=1 Tax=Endozoicomonas sp. OPT23 TaxID=2072845 RepID=UPI00129B2D69|nr:hypothetical protein [Endozoicomonas sp. OPT23]MRI33110.1 hypothetical protein [Endozoicomonas sp. OPT23]
MDSICNLKGLSFAAAGSAVGYLCGGTAGAIAGSAVGYCFGRFVRHYQDYNTVQVDGVRLDVSHIPRDASNTSVDEFRPLQVTRRTSQLSVEPSLTNTDISERIECLTSLAVNCIQNCDPEALKQLLQKQPSLAKATDWGLSLITIACRESSLEIVQLLYDYGADLHVVHPSGKGLIWETLAHDSARSGSEAIKVLKFLLANDVEFSDSRDENHSEFDECLFYLLQKKWDYHLELRAEIWTCIEESFPPGTSIGIQGMDLVSSICVEPCEYSIDTLKWVIRNNIGFTDITKNYDSNNKCVNPIYILLSKLPYRKDLKAEAHIIEIINYLFDNEVDIKLPKIIKLVFSSHFDNYSKLRIFIINLLRKDAIDGVPMIEGENLLTLLATNTRPLFFSPKAFQDMKSSGLLDHIEIKKEKDRTILLEWIDSIQEKSNFLKSLKQYIKSLELQKTSFP